jgi:DNA-binding Lrp family transcriptional regulator
MMEYVDETAAKIVLATSRGDSIRRISQKIGGTYSWVHTWVERLEAAGIIGRENGVHVANYEVREHYDRLVAAISRRAAPSIDEGYVIPHFATMPFAYTRVDAVYTWTHGGYQIAREHDDYPIFIRVSDRQTGRWTSFFDRYGIPTRIEERADPDEYDGSVHYVLFPTSDEIARDWVDGNPVVPLDETVDHMTDYRMNYEPALEMVADEYDLEIYAAHDDRRLQA